MINLFIEKNECTGCSTCIHACPAECITMQPDNEGFLYPIIENTKCTECGICKKKCPILSNKCVNPNRLSEPFVYAVKHKNEAIRLSSSSGGAFSGFADAILKEKGLIAGAAFDNNFNVHHALETDKLGVAHFKGSKYVQSKMGSIFIDIKKILKEKKNVLFSGTPCQIAGLYAFLKKDYKNLFTVDIICHGVSSPKVFNDYKNYQKKKYKSSKISFLSFRNWNEHWRDSRGMKIVFDNHSYEKYYTDDYFYRLYFGRSSILRPSCHNCQFCKTRRIADISLGDFWNIEKYHSTFANHKKGVSVVLLNTQKGAVLFEKCKDNFVYLKSNIKNCTQYNLKHPTKVHPKRFLFWMAYKYFGFTIARAYAEYGIVKSIVENIFRKN